MAKKPDKTKPEGEAKNKGGRPTLYSQAMADTICSRLIEGESLRGICRDDAMPCIASVLKWLRENDEFSTQYARAKEEQAEALADEIVSISDEGDTKVVVGNDGTSVVVFDSTAVARNRLRVDARKWVASKLKPKKYGDKVQQEISGPDGGPVQHKYTGLSDEQLEAEVARRLADLKS